MQWFISKRIVLVSLLFPTFALSGSSTGAAERKPPNVLFIVADDLGAHDLGCYGADLHETPNIDGLARQGIQFTTAYASAPVCTPTRAALMTGKSPARLNMTIWHESAASPPENPKTKLLHAYSEPNLPFDELTLAELFKEAGYRTMHFGKWHLGEAPHYPENNGFDINIGGTLWGAPPTFFYPFKGGFGRAQEPRYVPGMEWSQPGDYLTDRLTDKAIDQIKAVGDNPFFLYLSYYSVHTPIEAKEQDIAYFEGRVKPEMTHTNPVYSAMVKSLDENVGRLLRTLKEQQYDKNTIVVFTSDNGGFTLPYRGQSQVTNNAPLRSGKGSLYEGGIRVPLIMQSLGWVEDGTKIETPVITHDFLPTLAEVCRLDDHEAESREGVSLLSLLRGEPDEFPARDLFFHYPHYYFGGISTPCSAVRSGDWKLIRFYETNEYQLFDLNQDPSELTDLNATQPKVTADLKQKLNDWLSEVDAQYPSENPDWSGKE
ncbi:Arylsulfatase [Polystyrenella longa]|uniref:Arylsulfatase n=1 Tax=Polystyrenella longa TaxID=2528007 RepID=A0A518CQ99_9PLAN|nr:sulfatase [Polystyrenella longa]QDU81380.1 Arylsulfatase [Polystyrenella longa]